MSLKTGEIRALITGDYSQFKRATTAAKREAKDTRDELSKPIIVSGDAKKLLAVMGGLPAAGAAAGAGMAAGLAAPGAVIAAIGVAALASNEQVKTAYSDMADHVAESVRQAAAPLLPYVLDVADQVEARFNLLQPHLNDMFAEAGPQLQTYVDGLLDFTENAMPGMVAAIQNGQPVAEGFARFFGQAGAGVSDMLTEWSKSSHSAGQALDDLGGTVQDLLGFLGKLLSTVSDELAPRFTQVKDILGDAEDAIVDVADGALPILSSALGLVLDGAGALLAPIGALAEGFADLPAPIQAALFGLIAWRAMQSRFVGEHDSLGQRLSQPWKRFGDEVRVQTALAAASGHENLGRLAVSMAVVESRVPFIGRMGEAYRNASASVVDYVRAHAAVGSTAGQVDMATGAVTRLGSAAVGTAAALGSGLKSAATGLVGVLGGPWGLALTAGAALLGVWAAKQQEAAAKQRESAAASNAYARALRESNGVITESIRKQAAENAEKKGALKNAKDLGISLSEVTNAVMGQGNAYDTVRSKLQALVKEHSHQVIVTQGAKSGIETYKTELDATGQKAQGLLNDLGDLNGQWNNGTSEARRLAEATGEVNAEMGKAPAAAGPMGAALVKLADISASAEDKISALKSALDQLAGRRHTVEEANQAVHDSMRDLGESFKDASKEAKDHKVKLIESSGAINTVTEKGSALQDKLMSLSGAYREQFAAVVENAQAQGKTLPEAVAAATAATDRTRQSFINAAVAAGISRKEAEKLADQYDLLPEAAATAILQPGMVTAINQAGILRDKIVAVPNDKTVVVSSTTPQQIALLENMGFRVTHLPGGHVQITSNTGAVESDIDKLTRPRTMTVTIDYRSKLNALAAQEARMSNADGRVMEYFAAGGLRPMSASTAAIVGSFRRTGVERVIGDNPVADEAFIPLERYNARAQAILDEVLHRMRPDWFAAMRGAPMLAMANGGVYDTSSLGRSSDYSRHTTNNYNITGPSPTAIARQIDEYNREQQLLYGG